MEDPGLCKVLAERKLGLTVCPISNAFVTGGPQTDVIKQMLDMGLRVTVNSDDPAYFAGYIEENFTLVQQKLDLGPAGLTALSRNAFEAAWLPRQIKDRYLSMLDAHAAAGV